MGIEIIKSIMAKISTITNELKFIDVIIARIADTKTVPIAPISCCPVVKSAFLSSRRLLTVI